MSAIAERVDQGPLLLRRAELVETRPRERILELIVIPYEQPVDVPHPFQGLSGPRCTETIARGSFDGIEGRPNRVKAYRDHDEIGLFGRALSFHPGDPAGLRAEIKVSKTALGDETLELAGDGCLGASAGFRPKLPGGLQWIRANAEYRITKAWLRHIALVPDPAYEGAQVLAVRAAAAAAPAPVELVERTPMPNLHALELRRALELEAAIDAKYLR